MRLRFFLAEALRSIRANVAISVAATVTVLNAVFILGAFIPVYLLVQSEVDQQKSKLDIRAYIDNSATVRQVNNLNDRLKELQTSGQVRSFEYVSKEEALEDIRQRVDPSVLEELPANPLPASFEIKPDDPENADEIIAAIENHPALDKADPISYGKETADKVIRAANIIQWSGLALIIVLMIASILQIANTIRLSIFARRREVEVMKLVGGTNWFIRWPFMIEGVICGLVGALVSVLLLWAVKVGVVDSLLSFSDSPLGEGENATIDFRLLCAILIGSGAVVGALGSGLTLRRFLKV